VRSLPLTRSTSADDAPRRRRLGGVLGNERLTAATAAVLLVLLAIEGVTVLSVRQLLSLHVFVGMLLVPPVVLKLGSTGYRFVRYYTGNRAYREQGPPRFVLRLVAPFVVASTVALFGTGIALIALGPGTRFVLPLHKASFVVWFGAMSIHVLGHLAKLPRLLVAELRARSRVDGFGIRAGLVVSSLVLGTGLALSTLELAEPWLKLHTGFDA